MPGCKIGARPTGSLDFKTKKIYTMGNTPLRDDYDWFNENERMAKGKGIAKDAKSRRNDW